MQSTQASPGLRLTPRRRVKLVMEMEEGLHRELKVEAARRGTTMRSYITGLIERGHREEMGKVR